MSTVDWLLVGLAGPLYLAGIHALIRLDVLKDRRLQAALQQALDIANGTHRCGDDTCTEDHGERAGVAS